MLKICTLKSKVLIMYSILNLVGCDDKTQQRNKNESFNQAPTNVILTSVNAVSQTSIDLTWDLANDDNTEKHELIYEIHVSEDDNFIPTNKTLKFRGKNIVSIKIGGIKIKNYDDLLTNNLCKLEVFDCYGYMQLNNLKPVTNYKVRLVVYDNQGFKTISDTNDITTFGDMIFGLSSLNDTGIVKCVGEERILKRNHIVIVNCDQNDLNWQDGRTGQDALFMKNQLKKVGTGLAGFDFTKISSTGEKLDVNAKNWSCILDNHTGLMWENKTDDKGLHHKDNKYTWYNSDTKKNGNVIGNFNNSNNSESFVNLVNVSGLCGYKNWRLPDINELLSIVDYGMFQPAIDLTYFANTQDVYWSNTSRSDGNLSAMVIKFHGASVVNSDKKDKENFIRLVRTNN